MSSLKLPFTPTLIPYGSGAAAEAPVAPSAPAGGNGGATAPGVSATAIQLGQLISLTGLAPGVFQGVANSAKAYVDYVNSTQRGEFTMSDRDAVIVDSVRTPIGKRGGALSGHHAVDLSAHVLSALCSPADIANLPGSGAVLALLLE